MMYYLNKTVGFVISPVGIAIFGGLVALLCARLGRKRLAKWLCGLTVAWLWLWMTPIITWVVGVPLEREFLVDGKVPAVETFPEADAIVLLGGSMGIATNMSQYAEMATSADRVWQAARLYKAGKASEIIATGDYAKDTTLPLLKEFGVGEEAVSFLDARTTEEEAKGIRELFSRVERVERVDVSRKERKERKDDSRVDRVEGGVWSGYGGQLIYLKGYRDGTDEERVELLKKAIERICK